jgi:hypothetical protein
MQRTLFDRTIELSNAWQDDSQYRFFLRPGEGKDSHAAGAEDFRPNIVVVRERLDGRSLEQCVEKHRKAMREGLESAALLREGGIQIAGFRGFEQQYLVSLPDPLPRLVQWHVTVVCNGHCYFFCATSQHTSFEADRVEFWALMQSLR